MMLAGDEFARTQRGNNNAYCQDNEISWVDWSLLETNASMHAFTQRVLALRKATPLLHRSRYLHVDADPETGVRELLWIGADGNETDRNKWTLDTPCCFGMLIDGEARPSGLPEPGNAETLLLLVNDQQTDTQFTLPRVKQSGQWTLVLSTEHDVTTEASHEGGTAIALGMRLLMLWKYVLTKTA
jgi:glycogen operon protein